MLLVYLRPSYPQFGISGTMPGQSIREALAQRINVSREDFYGRLIHIWSYSITVIAVLNEIESSGELLHGKYSVDFHWIWDEYVNKRICDKKMFIMHCINMVIWWMSAESKLIFLLLLLHLAWMMIAILNKIDVLNKKKNLDFQRTYADEYDDVRIAKAKILNRMSVDKFSML